MPRKVCRVLERILQFGMTHARRKYQTPEITAIHRYLDSLDLYLLTTYDWSVIRQGLAAATGIEVTDTLWRIAIDSYVDSIG
jgi:hypothetical protein